MSTGIAAIATIPGLVEILRRYRLLDGAHLDTAQRELCRRSSDPRALGAELLQRGWLTAYQLNQIFQGRAAQLLLEPYVVLERLGEGSTGQVFKARHQHMQRIAALKVIRKELLADSEVLQRFYREIEVASQVSHPNVVHAYDAGPVGDNHMLVMEYIEGVDLQRHIEQVGPLPPALACDYARQAALGLHHIHERGLVHRDIKPSNLLLADSGRQSALVKILDLGLARLLPSNARESNSQLTQLGSTMGTPDYMSPEQAIELSSVDIRADIYSLGCTWFYLLTGKPPYAGGSHVQRLMRHQQAPIPSIRQLRAELPKSFDNVLGRMLAKKPNERYATPAAVAHDLGALACKPRTVHLTGNLTAKMVLPAPLPADRRRVARRRLRLGLLALLLLAGLVGAMFLLGKRSGAIKPDSVQVAALSSTAAALPSTRSKTEPSRVIPPSRPIAPSSAPVPVRHLSAKFTEPANPHAYDLFENGFRRMTTDGKEPIEVGPLNTPYTWEADAEYNFRTRVFGETGTDRPINVTILVQGKDLAGPSLDADLARLSGGVLKPTRILQTFAVKANKRENAEILQVRVPAIANRQRMVIAIDKPEPGQPPARLFVEYFALEGPLPASGR